MRVAVLVDGAAGEGWLRRVADDLTAHAGAACTVASPRELADHGAFDVAIAGSWRSALALGDVPAARRIRLAVEVEDRAWLASAEERRGARGARELPVPVVATARWVADELEALGTAAPIRLVRDGLDGPAAVRRHAVPAALDGPLRVAVAAPLGGDDGVADALAAVEQMHHPCAVTRLPAGADAGAAIAVLRGADVLVDLRRGRRGAGGIPEAFACGATCVTTPADGHDELLADGESGLVTSWDDVRGTARLLDLLAADRRLLHRLRVGALHAAASWPTRRQSAQLLGLVLRRLLVEPAAQEPAGSAVATPGAP